MLRSARILERMVNQNNPDEISLGYDYYFSFFCIYICLSDFKFYEDGADEFKENEETLFPVWKFSFDNAGTLENTDLCWNPAYTDLFAASFGSCMFSTILKDFSQSFFHVLQDNMYKQGLPGVICIFSLKTPSYPEYQCWAPFGVMCIDFHPRYCHCHRVIRLTVVPSTFTCWWLGYMMVILRYTTYRGTVGSQAISQMLGMGNIRILSGRLVILKVL